MKRAPSSPATALGLRLGPVEGRWLGCGRRARFGGRLVSDQQVQGSGVAGIGLQDRGEVADRLVAMTGRDQHLSQVEPESDVVRERGYSIPQARDDGLLSIHSAIHCYSSGSYDLEDLSRFRRSRVTLWIRFSRAEGGRPHLAASKRSSLGARPADWQQTGPAPV